MRTLLPALILLFASTGAAASQPSTSIEVLSSLFNELEAEPGQTVEGTIAVKNSGESPVDVRISVLDYSSRLGGVNNYSPPDGRARSSASWITLPLEVVTVGPGTTRPVAYSVRVPDPSSEWDTTGTHWSTLMVEPAELDTAPVPGEDGTMTIRTRVRYAVHVAVQLPGGTPDVQIVGATLNAGDEDGARSLSLDLENAGTGVVRPETWLELYTEDGEPVDRISGSTPLLYPGNKTTVSVPLVAVPDGTYSGVLFVDGGLPELIGQRLNVDLRREPASTADEGLDGR